MRSHVLITVALVAALVTPTVAAAAPTEIPLCTAEASQKAPDIWAGKVVWEDERWGYDDLWAHDLGKGEQYRVSSATGPQANPSVYGSVVVAEDGRNGVTTNLFSYSLAGLGEASLGMTGLYDRYEPVVFGNRIAWKDGRKDFDVYVGTLDGSTPEKAVTLDGYQQSEPAISDKWVVWRDQRLSAGANGDIYGYKFSTGNSQAICTDPSIQDNPAVSGQMVVWEDFRNDDYDILGKNMDAAENPFSMETTICAAPGAQTNPDVDGNWVVWQDSRNGDFDIYAYNLLTKTELPVCTAAGDQVLPTVSGNWVVWQDYRGGSQSDIYAACLVPTADLSASAVTAVSTVVPGQSMSVGAAVANGGAASSAPCQLGVYLSKDGSVDRKDRRIGNVPIGAVEDGTALSVKGTVWVPKDMAIGSYTLGVIADDSGALLEPKEGDNVATFGKVTVSRPANDSFSTPRQLSGVTGSVSSLSYAATKQTGEPKHAGATGGASVWFRWKAPSNGRMRIDLKGSSFDTVLGVYTGSSVGGLTKVVANDDYGTRLQSAAVFTAKKGVTYSIAVDGFEGAPGSVKLAWTHKAQLSTPATPTYVRRGARFTTAGKIVPRHASSARLTLYFERKEAGVWRLRKTVRASVVGYSTYSRYSARTALPYTGTWRVRARFSDSVHAPSYSAYRTFRVR